MIIKASLIYDELFDNMDAVYEMMSHNLTQWLVEAIPNVPTPVAYEAIMKSCPEELVEDLKQVFMKPVYGVRLGLKNKPSAAHSGWIVYAVTKVLANERKSPVEEATTVGILQNGRYERLRQFSLLAQETLLCSIGRLAKECLQAVVDAENSFDPLRFDADGYQRTLLEAKEGVL